MSQSPPQTLDDLLFRAEEFARFSMRARGKVPPAPLALGPDGPLFFIPSNRADERAKDNFATAATSPRIDAFIRVAPRNPRKIVRWIGGWNS